MMTWMRFTDDFDFSPEAKGGRVTIAYKKGSVWNVTRECAAKAKAARKGVPAKNPRKVDDGTETVSG